MGFRFRIRVFPGVKLNFSKYGVSTSLGVPGASVNFNKRGRRATFWLPGSGLSYQTDRTKWVQQTPPSLPPRGQPIQQPAQAGPDLRIIAWIALAGIFFALVVIIVAGYQTPKVSVDEAANCRVQHDTSVYPKPNAPGGRCWDESSPLKAGVTVFSYNDPVRKQPVYGGCQSAPTGGLRHRLVQVFERHGATSAYQPIGWVDIRDLMSWRNRKCP
jgi:hypothetical protein